VCNEHSVTFPANPSGRCVKKHSDLRDSTVNGRKQIHDFALGYRLLWLNRYAIAIK